MQQQHVEYMCFKANLLKVHYCPQSCKFPHSQPQAKLRIRRTRFLDTALCPAHREFLCVLMELAVRQFTQHPLAQKTEALLAQATCSAATLATLSRWDRKRHKVSNQERKQAANRPPRDRIKTEPFAFENPL